MSIDTETIGQFIKSVRDERGISQKKLAELLATSQSAVADIEAGKRNITTATLAKISKALSRDIVTMSDGSVNLRIKGGKKLSGSITTQTSKNAAVALLCASLLNRGTTTLTKVPLIEEVFRLIEVLRSIGVQVKREGTTVTITPPDKFDLKNIDEIAARKTRSIIMFAGALANRLDVFTLPFAGGCRLGARSIAAHLHGLAALGITNQDSGGESEGIQFKKNQKPVTEVIMSEAGDTATNNVILAAASLPQTTTIRFASANYMVQDLCYFLERLGVKITGIGTTTIVVTGVENIDHDVTYSIMEDPIDSMFFMATAVTTGSSIEIKRCPVDFLELEMLRMGEMGVSFKRSESYCGSNGFTKLADITVKPPKKLVAPIEKIESRPYPALNIDNLPFFVVMATQAEGTTMVHDWVFENRAIYYKELDKLGADILLSDPHRCYITGPTKLTPTELICPPALRPAALILIGMLAADGVSLLRNVYSINRGYEDIAGRLRKLGANVRVETGQ